MYSQSRTPNNVRLDFCGATENLYFSTNVATWKPYLYDSALTTLRFLSLLQLHGNQG